MLQRRRRSQPTGIYRSTIPAPAITATVTYAPNDNKPASNRGMTTEPTAAAEELADEAEPELEPVPTALAAVGTAVTVAVPAVPAALTRAAHSLAVDAV